jgi:hypothetical protein
MDRTSQKSALQWTYTVHIAEHPFLPPQNLQLEFALFAVGGTLDSVKLEEMSDLGLRARALNHVVRR